MQLLDMSRIVSGKMRLDIARVRFGAVIDEAVQSVQAAADAKGVRLEVASGTPLECAPTRRACSRSSGTCCSTP